MWALDRDAGRIDVDAFEPLPRQELADEAEHLGRFLDRESIHVGRGRVPAG